MCKGKEARKSTAGSRFMQHFVDMIIYVLTIDSMIIIAFREKVFWNTVHIKLFSLVRISHHSL